MNRGNYSPEEYLDEVQLRTIGCTLRLSDIYDRVLPPPETEPSAAPPSA